MDACEWEWEVEEEGWEGKEEAARALRMQGRDTTAEIALKELRIDKRETLAVFLLGSRLWGNAKENSDYDLLIVMKRTNGREVNALHRRDFDATVMSLHELKERIERKRMPEILLSHLPDESRWYVSDTLSFASLREKEITKRNLISNSVRDQSVKDWKRAQKLRARGDLRHAQKVLIHTVRYALLARQLLTFGSVVQWTCAQPFAESLQYDFDSTDERWDALGQRLQALLSLLDSLAGQR